MKRKDLTSKVLTIITQKQPIKAIQIAQVISKETGKTLKRKKVNSVLYSELRNQVSQNKEYKWSLTKDTMIRSSKNLEPKENLNFRKNIAPFTTNNNKTLESTKTTDSEVIFQNSRSSNLKTAPKKQNPENKNLSLLGRLASYYLECLSFERDSEVSVYSTSKYDTPEYVQLGSLPNVTDDFHNYWDQENVRQLITKVKRGKSNQKLYLGYPVFARPTPKGRYIKLEPLFLFSFDLENEDGRPCLSDEAPRINLAGFKGYAEEGGNLFDDLIKLQHDLGLDKDIEDLPQIDELIVDLKKQRPLWPWVGKFDPLNLDDVSLTEVDSSGIYNAAILVKGAGSKFTKGLEKELGQLKDTLTSEKYKSSVLAQMLGDGELQSEEVNIDVVEGVQLNHEQKEAVQSVFKNSLTVITGPPGTGKSQVVTAMLVNAALEGWKVLFTSKNNKAVDVVEQRVNGLSHQPFVLRLGAKELQKSLAEKLSQLLSNQKSSDSLSNYERLKERHGSLSDELKELFDLMKNVIGTRNEIDRLDHELQKVKNKLPKIFFEKNNQDLVAKINKIEESLGRLNNKYNKTKVSKLHSFYWTLYSWFKVTKIEKVIGEAQDFIDEHAIVTDKSSSSKIENLYASFKSLKKIIEDSSKYTALKLKIKKLESFESLCSIYQVTHEKLVETDTELWKDWLALTSYRMNDEQRQILAEYVSVLKYIVEANSQGGSINSKTWKDYYRLTQKVAQLLPVWAVTSLSVNGRLPLEPAVFDLVIIDEASQCDIASLIPLLYRAKRVVILGDPNQLRHITTLSGKQDLQLIEKHDLNNHITWGYAKNSCFDLAASLSKNVITLKEHHRSHDDIIQFSNQAFYNGSLRVATKTENLKKLKGNQEANVEWYSVEGQVERFKGSGACNKQEAQAIFEYVEDLVKTRSYKGTIGVVTPFRGQANIIRELFAKSQQMTKYLVDTELLIDTVHKFQGDEKDIIIFSPVVSHGIPDSAVGFLRSQGNLFNVAITRAKSHLTVIGDQSACKKSGVSYLVSFVDYTESLKIKKLNTNLLENDLSHEYPQVVYDSETVSDWEVKFYRAMYNAGLRPIPQYKEDKYKLDFAIFDGSRKLNIEVDGEKFHKDWDGSLILEDQVRNDRLRELGWTVKRFWVFQIRDEEDLCIQEIQEWLENEKRDSA